MTFVAELEPRALWRHFDGLLAIPRGSKREDAARAHVRALAETRGLHVVEDAAGNMLVRKPGAAGREGAAGVVLQAHLDMVQEKNADTDHDFATDPIQPVTDGPWLRARGTTLGADNGIGVAAMLALMEADEVEHGPLELLFTVDEETGLTGAKELPGDLLHSRRLINLDSEEEGVITIGCAGGGDSRLYLPVLREPVAGGVATRIGVRGLRGGHSGVDIHLQRANAIRLLARLLKAGADEVSMRIVAMQGGNARNAIPREASAVAWCADRSESETFAADLRREAVLAAAEFGSSDPDIEVLVDGAEAAADALSADSTRQVLDLLTVLPDGVMRMSDDLPGLVETSTNLAVVREESAGRVFLLLNSRSSVESALLALRGRIRVIGETMGCTVEEADGYPAWQPDVSSELLAIMQAVYEKEIGSPPDVGAMHAGLECGIIGRKYPGMDMVSFGPRIEFPHSPDERVRIDTVDPFYRVLARTLEQLAGP